MNDNADEIVKALREPKCGTPDSNGKYECNKVMASAADLIESLQAQLAEATQLALDVTNKYETSIKMHKITADLLAESQRREQAAVEDITTMAKCKLLGTCTFCTHRNTPDMRYKPCKGCIQENRSRKNFEWRGPQEAGK